MRILIATAGELSPGPVADLVSRIDGAARRVVVATVIEVPRSFLEQIRAEGWHPLGAPEGSVEEDEIIARYVDERGARITDPIVAALDHHGIPAETLYLEGEDPAATIVNAAHDMEADLLVVGATKQLFDESHWESVTSRVVRDVGRPVLVVPSAAPDDTGEMDLPTSEVAIDD